MNIYKLILLLILIPVFSQGQTTKFLFDRPTLKKIDSVEMLSKGQAFHYSYSIGVAKDYFPNADKYKLDNPKVFDEISGPVKLEISYYYSLPDSTIRLIEYWWEGTASTSKQLNEINKKNIALISAYFKNKGHTKGQSLAWKNKTTYVSQFFYDTPTMHRYRVLISWQ